MRFWNRKKPAKTDAPRRRFWRSAWLRLWLYMAIFFAALFFGGFLGFIYKVGHLKTPTQLARADGIVVWTGKGGDRLQSGADLLKADKGERLLVSGVNSALSPDQIHALLGLSDEMAACCVDLDYEALDTVGNARETANWAKALGYNHIILVTSAYHMPRAEIEIAMAGGELQVTSYPVASDIENNWWTDQGRFQRMVQEYVKLFLTNIRYMGTRPDNRLPTLNQAESAASSSKAKAEIAD